MVEGSNKIAHEMESLVKIDALAHKVASEDNESCTTHPIEFELGRNFRVEYYPLLGISVYDDG